MKIRNGFVSNSSSSSFLIAVKVGEACACCGRRDPNFLDFFRDSGEAGYDSDNTQRDARGLVETLFKLQRNLDDYGAPVDSYEIAECDQIRERMEECKKYTEDGYEVGYVRIGYYDSSMQRMFEELKRTGAVTVIESYG